MDCVCRTIHDECVNDCPSCCYTPPEPTMADSKAVNEGPKETLAHQMARWLCAIGYGVDFSASDHPLPEEMRLPLAVEWWRRDGCPADTSIDDYYGMLEFEGAW